MRRPDPNGEPGPKPGSIASRPDAPFGSHPLAEGNPVKLTRLDEDGAGQVLETDAENVVVGRKPARGLPIDHATVSREHARLFLRDGRLHVADLNSSNGTFVNGRKVSRSALDPGDLLKLGSVEYRVESESGAAAPSPAPTAPPSKASPPSPATAPSPVPEARTASPADEVDEIVLEDPGEEKLPIPPAARRPRTDDPERTMVTARRPTTAPPKTTNRPPVATAALRSDRSGGVLGQDLSQQGFGVRLLWVGLAVAIAYGLFLLTSSVTEKVVPEGGLPEEIESDDEGDGGEVGDGG